MDENFLFFDDEIKKYTNEYRKKILEVCNHQSKEFNLTVQLIRTVRFALRRYLERFQRIQSFFSLNENEQRLFLCDSALMHIMTRLVTHYCVIINCKVFCQPLMMTKKLTDMHTYLATSKLNRLDMMDEYKVYSADPDIELFFELVERLDSALDLPIAYPILPFRDFENKCRGLKCMVNVLNTVVSRNKVLSTQTSNRLRFQPDSRERCDRFRDATFQVLHELHSILLYTRHRIQPELIYTYDHEIYSFMSTWQSITPSMLEAFRVKCKIGNLHVVWKAWRRQNTVFSILNAGILFFHVFKSVFELCFREGFTFDGAPTMSTSVTDMMAKLIRVHGKPVDVMEHVAKLSDLENVVDEWGLLNRQSIVRV